MIESDLEIEKDREDKIFLNRSKGLKFEANVS